jgi:diacylglycerol O-acyltransferase-1
MERFLKLSPPVTYVWLLGFYAFFHVWLNLLAEVLRFGDRTFYKDWWNATDLEGYWRTWNMPVHCWIVRHAYFPLMRHVTQDKLYAGFACFTLSAVLHELVVAFPLQSFYMPLAFFGMMAQVPMLPLSAWLKRTTRGTAFAQSGNYLFWITFCFVGQPACVLLYYLHAVKAL